MRRLPSLLALAGPAALAASLVLAQDAPAPLAPEEAHEVREGHMRAYGAALRTLGGMAQGEVAFDAAAAQAAADSLLEHAATPDWAVMWPEGSAVGEIPDSRALPAIWESREDFDDQHQDLVAAATAMQAAAGTDLASLQAAMGGVGASCGTCHEAYRAPD